MKNNLVITVGRQYGSGGREIGMMLSEIFGIGYYDKNLITEAAKRSGLADETFEQYEERRFGTLWHALSTGFNISGGFSPEDIFRIQSETIMDIASKEPCVIVGRCADYVLRNNPECFSVFVHASPEVRTRRVAVRRNISHEQAAELIAKTDKSRASYYNFYTEKTWGYGPSYNLCIDSGMPGLEQSAQLIADFIRQVRGQRE